MLNKRIPALSSKVDPEVRRAIEILAEGLPPSVSDVPAIQNAISYLKSIGGTSYVAISAPTNFTATGAFKSILLSWSDNQIGKTVVGYEIYRANVNDLGSAVRVAFVSATIYSDIPPNTSTSVIYYYWIRAIGHNNNASGFVGPASASTATDPAYVLEILQNQITESQLYEDLNSRIDLIDTPTTGLVDSLQTEIINRENGDNALAQQISTLSVNSNEQFDSAKIWHFDNDVEGWSGNGTPTESNGWIKQADHASDPYLVSPTGVGVNGAAYQRIRLRYKKTGSPTWEGYIWWKKEGDTDWDTSRRITVSEPSYDIDNIANISEEITWDGTIDQIRIDLISAQDSSNYTEIDWVAIGRAAPGASVAALQEEKTARINGDDALANNVSTLQTTVGNHTTSIQQNATSIDGLNAQYTIKIDNNGFMSGYGLASTSVNGTPFSEFYVQANRFAVINPEVPPKVVTSITRDGTLATCTVPSHGFMTGKYHIITGAEQPEYNGAHLITVVDADTFTFNVSGSPATPATVAPGLSNIYVSGSEAAIPFIVQNGVNYLDTAMIHSLTADKITAGQMSGARIEAGTLDATTFKSSMGIVSVLQSPGFGSGNGWKLDGPNGTFEITSWGNVSSGANDLPQAFADVTDYQNPAIANNKTQNGLTTIPYPGGGSQRYTSSSVQGAIVITLPQSYNDAMVSFVVDIFNYYDQRSFSLYIAGYLYSNGNKWDKTTARIFGGLDADNRVRFTDDGNNACIIIGDTSDIWSYPSITVRNFRAWFNHYDIDLWDNGWSVSIETDLSAYSTPGADYADALLDANAIKNQGALATKDHADWATQVMGAGKPEDNADATPPLPSDEGLVGYWSFDEGFGPTAADSSGHGNDGAITYTNHLKSYWKFDEGSGTTAADSSGHGNDGTLHRVFPDDPVGYWSFDEGSGTTAADSSGHGNDGTLHGGPTWVNGISGKALSFDGTSKNISIPWDIIGGKGVNLISNYSFSAWYKGNPMGIEPLIQFGGYTNNIAIGSINSGVARIHCENNNTRKYVDSTTNVQDGDWHFICGVYDKINNIIRIFVDGVEEGNLDITGFTANSGGAEACIGSTTNGQTAITSELTNRYVNGLIDEVRIYNRALTASEVEALYNNPAPLPQWAKGIVGACLSFDGTGDECNVADTEDINLTDVYTRTYSLWIKASLTSGHYTIYKEGDATNGISIYIENNVLYFTYWANGSLIGYCSIPFTYTDWQHIVCIFDSASGFQGIYLNGQEGEGSHWQDNKTDYIPSHAGDINIGYNNSEGFLDHTGSYISASYYFAGLIDEYRIYDKALTSSEVEALYNNPAPLPQWAKGIVGACLSFDGTGDECNVADTEDINLIDVYTRTYSLWVKASSTSGHYTIYKEGDATNGISIYIENNVLYFTYWANGSLIGYCSIPFTYTDWQHIVCIFDSASGFQGIYLNGQEGEGSHWQDNKTDYIPSHAGDINIGYNNSEGFLDHTGSYISASYYFAGLIDEYRIYDKALTAKEIKALYLNPGGLKAPYPGADNTKGRLEQHITITAGGITLDGGQGVFRVKDESGVERVVMGYIG